MGIRLELDGLLSQARIPGVEKFLALKHARLMQMESRCDLRSDTRPHRESLHQSAVEHTVVDRFLQMM